jgi:TfdA family taurine catabolism dioxygenase TauD
VADREIVPISNQRADGTLMNDDEHGMQLMRGNEGWHTDSSYMPLAAKASVLSARVIPSTGGQTEWADMRATQVGLAEYLSLPVAKVPVADTRPGLLDSCPQAERAQDADAVGLHGKAGPDGVPRGAALNELGRKTMLVQRRGQGEAGDAATDDQDSFNVGHLSLRRLSQSFSLSFREGW